MYFLISLRVIWSFHTYDWVPVKKHQVQGEEVHGCVKLFFELQKRRLHSLLGTDIHCYVFRIIDDIC